MLAGLSRVARLQFEPPNPGEIDILRRQFSGISDQYWTFVETYGFVWDRAGGSVVGRLFRLQEWAPDVFPGDLQYYLAHLASIYPQLKVHEVLPPAEFVVFSEPGADWVYCLKTDGSDRVFAAGVDDELVTDEQEDFYSFMERCFDWKD